MKITPTHSKSCLSAAFFISIQSHKNPTKPRIPENNHIKTKNNCDKWLLIEI